MNALELPHALDRHVIIRARLATVFRYFTDSARWAAWWGEGSTIDARPGGRVFIRYPNAVEVSGEVVEVDPPRRIVFTYGYATGQPFGAGGSRVTIRLEEDPHGTRLHLRHEFVEAAVRDHHLQGWRYQLAVFSNLVADHQMVEASARVDAWFAAWSEADAARRQGILDTTVSPAVRFRDRFSLVEGRADLDPHLAAVHVFMPGNRIERTGDLRHCQGTVLADWTVRGADGGERGRGTNVFELDADGRIEDVVGIWSPPGR
ncbi:MAG: SRPBCC domain-containing protein [Candidatus Eiseniibacteriota bacterium]